MDIVISQEMLIILSVTFVALLILVTIRHNLISLEEKVFNHQPFLDEQIKIRHNILPLLLQTIQEYTHKDDKEIKQVIEHRAQGMLTKGFSHRRAKIESELSTALISLLKKTEKEGKVKKDIDYLEFKKELHSVVDQLDLKSKEYNEDIKKYNKFRGYIPIVLIAKLFSFKHKDTFQIKFI